MDGQGANKKYGPVNIPRRAVTSEAEIPAAQGGAFSGNGRADSVFYEIEYDPNGIAGVGKFVQMSRTQKIGEPPKDEIRELFGRMRDIAREYRGTYDFSKFFERRIRDDNAAILYRQGMFMKDFADDYAGSALCSQYFPCYQMMGYEQLRTYFTWRTRVRNGNIADTCVSYAYLYMYELIGNIGVSDPGDGLCKLISFWKAFRGYDSSTDKYVLRWLKDYYIYYGFERTFEEFAADNAIAEYYPASRPFGEEFDLFCAVSKYNIKKSAFFNDETNKMIRDCFSFVIDALRRDFKAARINFDNALFHPSRKVSVWKPFKDALFYPWMRSADRKVILSENEIYMCKDGEWTFSSVITTEKGRKFIGYVMKQMESDLRRMTKYKFKLTADTGMLDPDTLRVLTKAGIFTRKTVEDAVIEYYREATKTVVTVDSAALERLRREALVTQKSLSIEEQAQPKDIAAAPEVCRAQDLFSGCEQAAPEAGAGVWDDLKDALSEYETAALALLLRGGDLKTFARERGIMPEVIADAINEKAADYLGDSLMDEDFALYDEYKGQVKELVR